MTYQEIHDEISNLITESVLELKDEHQTHDKKGNITDKFYDEICQRIWQDLDGHEWVIYTHLAKEVTEAVNQYDAFDTWDEVTGERFSDWMQVSFANMYHVFLDINLIEFIKEVLNDNKNY